MIGKETEADRCQWEARHWLQQGHTSAKSVNLLQQEVIAAKRGAQATQGLRDGMRQQWKVRRQWKQENVR
ncbi:DUF7696 family protein [Xanthomonas cannabis]|uniref:Uncharacterized protein n=1 Tax=Xanthomonas cannabis TaxID=1885674 RepID=A0ABR6JHL9_9XANT|nr:hypothetical protein [Xanthomonas cannabis]MBB4591841.1 hypothetical protein [Xanthomonas cannabis]MBB5522177.1 hypothetical protein [Xanthomonas cannabis]